mmetsp:Transcript_21447/g.19023  ORF Transcript_21447/g.19023 Transcript_21447/m.19023 type:complete len:143 (-) Transcript_21447:589-1017(-)|eukprot:CAMPEP_0205807570 /NCGR_PEP_ID=MMETSP0205-20121125/11305_1 /ASSEMBLY_ACC=CAM_ASM_000278 /TAXON_ID=36767 /ORGANISM="Euplotes focardii, Strain TN1" /LENGTH=142 /DNA_ID=CAMNT_0053081943 /DNA_START=487 /DNA_END=912 /DNA_ORIENTATION=-
MKKKKSMKFIRMSPYIVNLQEDTSDFYYNFKQSVISMVADSIKKEGKLKDKDNIQENLKLKVGHYPQVIILSGTKKTKDDWRFKCVPNEFDLSKINDDFEEDKMEIEVDENNPNTIYEIRNIITVNKRTNFFEMINRDDGEW